MSTTILTLKLRSEQDLVLARQRARQIAGLLGFAVQDQTRLATAVSEIARNAFTYGGGGKVEFRVEGATPQQILTVRIRDEGPGIPDVAAILEGRYQSKTGLGLGIVGTQRLMDRFSIESAPGKGTLVLMGKTVPAGAPEVTAPALARIAGELARLGPQNPFEEIQRQNRELMQALDELRRRELELAHQLTEAGRLNRELDETNRGIVALYREIDEKNVALQQSNQYLEREVAERKRAEELLRTRNEELKAFAYTVSHDLKAPLRGIAGYASELDKRHRAGLSERAQFCINQIQAATGNLDHLIEDLLHYSRLDREEPTLTEVNLPGLVEAILQDRSRVIEERGAQVSVTIPLATVRGWERALTQVLTNLIDNAIKFSRDAKPPRIRIDGEELDTTYRLTVSDNGIGFDMKYHDRIFGLFNRLVRQEEYEGTGAGLAIVQKLLDKQGGKIWAESQPGAGATFYVELPKQP
jgi:signal transduction histidine kinase